MQDGLDWLDLPAVDDGLRWDLVELRYRLGFRWTPAYTQTLHARADCTPMMTQWLAVYVDIAVR